MTEAASRASPRWEVMVVTGASRPAAAGRMLAGVRLIAGVTLGGLTAVVTLAFLIVACPVILLRRGQPRVVAAAARRLADFERGRLTVLFGVEDVGGFAGNRTVPYLAARCPVGLLGGAAVFL